MSFIDRVNIGNARLYGLEDDLGMTGNMFQIAVSILVRCITLQVNMRMTSDSKSVRHLRLRRVAFELDTEALRETIAMDCNHHHRVGLGCYFEWPHTVVCWLDRL